MKAWARLRHESDRKRSIAFRNPLFRIMLVAVMALLVMGEPLVAEHMPVESEGSIRATADYCTFRGDSTASYVEVYLQVVLKSLDFENMASGEVAAELEFAAHLTDPNRGRFIVRQWERSVRLPSRTESQKSGLSLFDLLDLALVPGDYELEITITEKGGPGEATIRLPLSIRDFSGIELTVSDIQFARRAEKAPAEGSLFAKSGYRIVPNPSRRYGEALPELCFYVEVYGLQDEGDIFTGQYEVTNMEGNVVFCKGPFFKQKSGQTAVLVGTIPVEDLASGFCRLSIMVADSITSDISSGSMHSNVFLRAEEEETSLTPPSWALSPAESSAAEMELRYVASANELRRFRELNPVGRGRFLEQFWARRDPDPSTPKNEERELLHQRIAFAQQEFGEIRTQGMDTDRGRVYIKYGPPNEITTMTGDLTCKDNEIWHYHMEVERIFVFLDEFNTNIYRLIHSNYPGEVSRPDWELLVCEQSHTMTFD